VRQSIFFRNFLITALIVLVSFTLLGGLSTAWSYRLMTSEKKETMSNALREASRYITTQYIDDGFDLRDLNLNRTLAMISGVSGFDLIVADTEGVITASSDTDFRHIGKSIPGPALTAASSGGYNVILTTLGQIYPELRQAVGAPLTVGSGSEQYAYGFLFVSSDSSAFRQAWRHFTGMYILIAVNVMALTFVISFLTTKKQARPLNDMAAAARRFARGDFSTRVEDYGRLDEIGQLTLAFNAMADSLENSESLRREFIANVSHELKTPMTVISGFTDGILDGTIPTDDMTRYLDVISSETRRLSRLIASMLDMSRLQSEDSEAILQGSFDVAEVVGLALLSLDGKTGARGVEVNAVLPEEPVIVRGSKDSITQVAYNLIDNAIKFSSPGDAIGIEVWKQGPRVYVSVENSGETIPEEELPFIFDRFHKADKSRSEDRDGVGLGLYIVKTILDKHFEDVFVTSGGGVTRFVFTLSLI